MFSLLGSDAFLSYLKCQGVVSNLFWKEQELQRKKPWLFHTEGIFVCMPLALPACCKLIPYADWIRGLWVTSKYEVAAVGEVWRGAHLNSPSVRVHQELMFQSWEERFSLKGTIENQYGSVRKKIN